LRFFLKKLIIRGFKKSSVNKNKKQRGGFPIKITAKGINISGTKKTNHMLS
jgi:hypothetical protein